MSWRGRLAIYAAIFGSAWWLTVGPHSTSVAPAASQDHRRALRSEPTSDRQGHPALPALPASEVEEARDVPPAPAREPVTRTSPVREDFVKAAGFTESQRVRFEVETALWSDAIARLARDAVANRWPTPYVSEQAGKIQTAYEANLKAFMSVDQLAVYGDFRSRGEIGIYAIELPVDGE